MFNKKMIKIASRAQYQLIFFSETLRSTGPRPLAAWASPQLNRTKRAGPRSCASAPQVHEACGAGRRSSPSGLRDMKTLSHVRLHGLIARSAHITSLLFFG